MKGFILSILVLFSFNMLYAQSKRDSIIRISKYGTAYPAFTLVTLDGDTLTEKQLIGKVTLINFWFESCAPCMAEMPALNELYLKYKDHPEFQLLSLAREYPNDAEQCVQKLNIPYPVCPVSDEESYRLSFNNGFPVSIITDTQGKIVLMKWGGPIEPGNAKKAIQKLEEKMMDLFTQQNKKLH